MAVAVASVAEAQPHSEMAWSSKANAVIAYSNGFPLFLVRQSKPTRFFFKHASCKGESEMKNWTDDIYFTRAGWGVEAEVGVHLPAWFNLLDVCSFLEVIYCILAFGLHFDMNMNTWYEMKLYTY